MLGWGLRKRGQFEGLQYGCQLIQVLTASERKTVTKYLYYQVPNTSPHPLINFRFFPTPWTLLGPSRLLILRKLTFFKNPSSYFFSLLVTFTLNFHGKIAYCCIYFSFILYDNLYLFLPSLYNQLKPSLKFRPPVYFDFPLFIKFRDFSDHPCLLGPLCLLGT